MEKKGSKLATLTSVTNLRDKELGGAESVCVCVCAQALVCSINIVKEMIVGSPLE